MRAFELYFNPRAKKDVVYDSFVFEPENVYEKKMGSLYIVGELANALPPNSHLINNLAKIIKEKYYEAIRPGNLETKVSNERNLKEGLKKANEFLASEIKKDNANWLGNLNFAVLSFKDFVLHFSKSGDIKILLLRAATGLNPSKTGDVEIMDIGSNLEFQNAAPSSKVFGNIVAGKLASTDKIMVLTKEAFELFEEKNLIGELAVTSGEKELKKFLKTSREIFREISGICLLVFLAEGQYIGGKPLREYFQTLAWGRKKICRRLSTAAILLFKYILSCLAFLRKAAGNLLRKIKKPNISAPNLDILSRGSKEKKFLLSPSVLSGVKRLLILSGVLALTLFIGTYIFK